jgi:putative endonuclease
MPRSRSGTGNSDDRRRRWRAGLDAEALAGWYLRLKGYRILARRVKLGMGEIDLVVLRRNVLVFVEVKTRSRADLYAQALESVNTRRIANAAAGYVARHPRLAGLDQRFDVIFLAPFAWPRHVTNAFEAS